MPRVFSCANLVGLSVIFLSAQGITEHSVQAQIVPDGTLNTSVNSIGNTFTITNGTVRSSNLFHSFGQFSIPTNGVAAFDLINTPNVSTIFSRVTGGSPSSIDGTIRALNGANSVSLFLLNPSGILFGANARLDIGGSFVGTTANSIRFADGVEFSADRAIAPLLTISVPIGLQMGQNPGAIAVNGTGHTLQLPTSSAPLIRTSPYTGLQVQPNQTLALVGATSH
jgi:filamentous hemagglutinin family protein